MAQLVLAKDLGLGDAAAKNGTNETNGTNGTPMPVADESNSKKGKQGPRKRVSQACDICRDKKDKCDGKKPTCSTCFTKGRTCAYNANVRKRGLPEGYVRGLEKLWGLAIRDVDKIEDAILTALVKDEDTAETALSNWIDEANSEALVELWRKSQISRELELLLSSREPSINTKRRRLDSDIQIGKKPEIFASSKFKNASESASTPETGWLDVGFEDPKWQQETPLDHLPAIDIYRNSSNRPGREVGSILSQAKTPTELLNSTPASSIDIQDLPSETWHLLDVYFSYTHPWLPIIEKHDLLRISYQYSQRSGASSGEHAVLWAVIAYAKFQHRAINHTPHALGNVGAMVWTADRMYAQARALIPNEEGVFEIGHVQALIILTLANMGMGQYSRAWSLIGQAVRLAIDLELDQPPGQIPSSSKARSRSKHVFLGCFVLDTLVAARMKRRPHLRADDIDTVEEVEEDGLEEWDPWTDCLDVRRGSSGGSRVPASILSTFNRLVQVLKILNQASCLSPGSNTLQSNKVLEEKLHIWSRSQPSPSSFDSSLTHQGQSLLPHQYHLHNVYFTTLATLQLPVLGFDPTKLDVCANSARHITGLLNQHSNIFGLLIVPPTYEYFTKTAYEIVHAIQNSIDNTRIALNDWKRTLDHSLDNMEPAWAAFESFKASSDYQSVLKHYRERQVNLDYMSTTQDYDSPSGRTSQSGTSHDTMSTFSPHIYRSEALDSPPQSRVPAKVVARPFSQRTTSFGQSSGNGLPMNPLNIYENAHAVYHPTLPLSSEQTAQKAQQQQQSQPRITRPTIILEQPAKPNHHRSLTMSSTEVDFDPTFNELMRLDAMEWSGNWDQSLLNLGFTDSENKNRDFHSFCQEPEPLYQNSVFQQLVANSNAEASSFFDGPAFSGAELGMNDESEGIEASQILQSLSSASEEPRPLGRGNKRIADDYGP